MLVPTAVAAGPLWARGLNQNAVNHTLAPGGTLPGKATVNFVSVVLPSNFHAAGSVGAAAPTKLKTLAPSTPSGFPLRVGLAASCRRRRTVFPTAETMSIPGASAGGGKGVGSTSGTTIPSSILADAWTAVLACMVL